MTLTDIAAGLGAATGTISLLWEIYKWAKSGPKLIVSVNPTWSHLRLLFGLRRANKVQFALSP